MYLFTQGENLGILLFAYHIGMVSYTTCFQNKIYVADKKPSAYQSAKSEDAVTLGICWWTQNYKDLWRKVL